MNLNIWYEFCGLMKCVQKRKNQHVIDGKSWRVCDTISIHKVALIISTLFTTMHSQLVATIISATSYILFMLCIVLML